VTVTRRVLRCRHREMIGMQVGVCTIFTSYYILQNVVWYVVLSISVLGETSARRRIVVRGIVAVGYTRGSGREEVSLSAEMNLPSYGPALLYIVVSRGRWMHRRQKGLALAPTLAVQALRRVLSIIAMRMCLIVTICTFIAFSWTLRMLCLRESRN